MCLQARRGVSIQLLTLLHGALNYFDHSLQNVLIRCRVPCVPQSKGILDESESMLFVIFAEECTQLRNSNSLVPKVIVAISAVLRAVVAANDLSRCTTLSHALTIGVIDHWRLTLLCLMPPSVHVLHRLKVVMLHRRTWNDLHHAFSTHLFRVALSGDAGMWAIKRVAQPPAFIWDASLTQTGSCPTELIVIVIDLSIVLFRKFVQQVLEKATHRFLSQQGSEKGLRT
mmetsp:Transcript_51887/g.93307  ORF Transcript_51887/g.93307 Transcript_51887/m.93307 type:complete len:228 (-) Transcript_51887:15-698(-)